MTLNNWIRKTWFPPLLLTALVLWGCDQSPMTTQPPEKATSVTSSDVLRFDQLAQSAKLNGQAKAANKQLEAISRAIAKVLANEEVRQYLHAQAMKKFDGETNVLWVQLTDPRDQGVPGGKGWNALIKENMPPGKARGMIHKMDAAIDRASRLLGGPIHLYWAFAERFDGSQTPLVTFAPVGTDADEITNIEAFDAEGDVHIVNEQVAEQRPVVVLAANERVSIEDLKNGALRSIDGDVVKSDLMKIDDPGSGGGGGYGGGGGDAGDDGGSGDGSVKELRLEWVQFYEDYEGWFRGDPEFSAKFVHYDGTSAVPYWTYFIEPKIPAILADGGYKVSIDQKIFNWHTDDYKTYFVKWYERDGGSKVEISLGVKGFKLGSGATATASVKITLDSRDNLLGEATIHLDDLGGGHETFITNAPNFNVSLN